MSEGKLELTIDPACRVGFSKVIGQFCCLAAALDEIRRSGVDIRLTWTTRVICSFTWHQGGVPRGVVHEMTLDQIALADFNDLEALALVAAERIRRDRERYDAAPAAGG